ncbi:MAG: hypothetical protein DMF89_01090 [Acidobacteria bacterium]|nr:MAG: hypothetical protein DMF89_01090 [Acidobacteriota bacterium]
MKSAKPPVVPTWLLERIGSDPNDTVLGDLIEQYGAGRSRFWYWRQALATVLFSATRDIRAYKLLAVRALVSGWILYVAFSFPVNWVSNTIRPPIKAWLVGTGHASFWWLFWGSRIPDTLLVYAACVASGWMIARFHRAHAGAVVCLFGASVLLFEYGFMSWMLFWYGHPPLSQAVLIVPAVLAMSRPLGIVIGGLSVPPERSRP